MFVTDATNEQLISLGSPVDTKDQKICPTGSFFYRLLHSNKLSSVGSECKKLKDTF